jgi:hypothetical protein
MGFQKNKFLLIFRKQLNKNKLIIYKNKNKVMLKFEIKIVNLDFILCVKCILFMFIYKYFLVHQSIIDKCIIYYIRGIALYL